MAHFILLKTEACIKKLALMFMKEIWYLYVLLKSIVSDSDTRFMFRFWTSLMKLLQVKLNLSTSFHPESNRQTERVNLTLEQDLRSYCTYQQDDWESLLPLAEHAYNTSMLESTKAGPYEINNGFSSSTLW